jgi:hypothetical protein
VNRDKHYALNSADIGVWNRAIITAKPSNIDGELEATLKSLPTELVMQWTRKPALKRLGMDEALNPLPTPIASAPFSYIMPRYAPPMPYTLMPYPYTMPLAIPAPASLSLPLRLRQASTPSPKAVMQLAVRQSSPIAPAKDPEIIMH